MRNLHSYLLLILGASLLSTSLQAQDEFERVEVLDHPRFSLTNRLVIDADLSFLPLDAYYKPILVDIAASYQFTDWFSWEVARLSWSLTNYDTGLNDVIQAKIQEEAEDPTIRTTTDQSLKDTTYKVSSTGFINLLYSKSNWFNNAVVYHYWQAGVGFGMYQLDYEMQQTLDLVLRARFFLNEHFMLNIRGGHSFGFNSNAPKNISFLSLGGGFAF
ncbi:MAG: hypothetical protein COV44_00330 [Deltaproteobacteria bacterium CG11_big_fil_rev_8_21_14_0_20_45_16]|nr:MAG: hypothetical protein COV44_00330 [Deltaproteobacteria bacterium CG11_big_fil_rev_8_21_14_0_20_45_16]